MRRKTIYIHRDRAAGPDMQIYRDLPSGEVYLQIHMGNGYDTAEITIRVPLDLQKRMGIEP